MRARPLHVALLLFLLAALAVAITVAGAPPDARPADAPAGEFSAGRAMQDVRGLTAGNLPHPVGSADHERAHAFVVDRLRALGLSPVDQVADACSRSGNHCATVRNVLARIDGTEPGPALMLAAHYDSVPRGPGAADDGAGVATILEIVRALKAGPPARRTLIVLIDDGEELGLLGARAFVDGHPWAKEVGVVLNFEARGTGGPTVMFETSARSAWLFEAYAATVRRPVVSSLVYTLYKRLPNDTDLTIFKAAGMQGLNFAFADHLWDYHTPGDSADRLDPRSLQHMGDQGLGATRALLGADLARPQDAEEVYFDLFSRALVAYRARWALPLAATGLALAMAALAMTVRRGRASVGRMALGAAVPLAGVVGAVAASFALGWLMTVAARQARPWWTGPMPAWVAMTAGAVAASSLAAVGLGELLAPRAAGKAAPGAGDTVWLWAGTVAFWTVLSVLLSLAAKGASYLFTFPAAASAAGLLVALGAPPGGSGGRAMGGLALGALVAALLWYPIVRVLLVMVGPALPPAAALPAALLVSMVAPALAGLPGRTKVAVPVTAAAVAVVAAAVAVATAGAAG